MDAVAELLFEAHCLRQRGEITRAQLLEHAAAQREAEGRGANVAALRAELVEHLRAHGSIPAQSVAGILMFTRTGARLAAEGVLTIDFARLVGRAIASALLSGLVAEEPRDGGVFLVLDDERAGVGRPAVGVVVRGGNPQAPEVAEEARPSSSLDGQDHGALGGSVLLGDEPQGGAALGCRGGSSSEIGESR